MATIIFDLDGTLIDTTELVLPAFREVIRHFDNHSMPSEKTLLQTFGMPDHAIWELLLPNATSQQHRQAHELSDQIIHEQMQSTDVLLPHAGEVLSSLRAQGHILTVASNCGEGYLNAVLDSQGIREFFTHPLCLGSVRGQRKADILSKHFQHFAKSDAIMVGDRHSDIEAAQFHQIPAIGCAFGFGNDAELQGAVTVIHALPELLPLFHDSRLALLFPHRGR